LTNPTWTGRKCDGDGHAIIGGRNYGQGSSRDEAALAVRTAGARVVLANSIARIHRENLVNYGVLPLLFVDPGDLQRLEKGRVLRLQGLHTWLSAPGRKGRSPTAVTAGAKVASGYGIAYRRARSTFCSPAAPSPRCGAASKI
jgi:aconitase A